METPTRGLPVHARQSGDDYRQKPAGITCRVSDTGRATCKGHIRDCAQGCSRDWNGNGTRPTRRERLRAATRDQSSVDTVTGAPVIESVAVSRNAPDASMSKVTKSWGTSLRPGFGTVSS